ncbi:MAG TPA: glycosyltransferase family 4 protein [Thermoanaerobaculia bacterium]|nr:glycosyltransferase family 4 protein [Thermoanaerobaculia bacterium]
MRLLWLLDSLDVGGAEALALPFASRTRHDLTVACMHAAGANRTEQELQRRGVRTVNFGARNLRDRAAFRRFADFVREERIDLVHAHLTYSAIWSAWLSRETGVPSITSLHATPAATKALESSAIRRFAIDAKDRLMRFVLNRWASRVIVVSAALGRAYADLKNVRVVHNGIDVSRFARDRSSTRARLDKEFGVSPGAKIAVAVSVLRARKGIEVLLEAAARVPDTTFLIIGDGPMRAEWESLARTDNVRWAGHRTDVEELLAGCDVFVHPSLEDAFPTVLLEAMAAGLPVVASNVGGIPEIVVDGVTGILVPPGQPDAIAAALHRTTPSMCVAALQRAQTEFSTDAWIARLENVYAEAAA